MASARTAFGYIRRQIEKPPHPVAATDNPSIAALIRRIDTALVDRRDATH